MERGQEGVALPRDLRQFQRTEHCPLSFKRKFIGLVVLAIGGTIGVNVWLSRMETDALTQASEIADGRVFCWVNGQFIQGDLPVSRLVAQGSAPFEPWADFRDAILNGEQAKPIHFGFVVPGDEGTAGEFWAWSYWERAYWNPEDSEALALLGVGQLMMDCRGR